jgi:trans-aconitate methyltransferase
MSETKISNSETRGPTARWLPEWNGELYAANTGHHRVYDAWFLERLPVRPTDRVLDIGCGSGDFTSVVAGLVPDGEVVGLDPWPSMLEEARRHARANQSFVLGAAQDLATLFAAAEPFDLVTSRAAMHWIPIADHPAVHAGAHSLLRNGGWYRIEMGGAGNIATIAALLAEVSIRHNGPASPWTFLDAGQALDLLEAAGFAVESGDVRTVAQHRAFDREQLLGWFRSQTFQAFAPAMTAAAHQAFRAEVEDRVDELKRADGTYDQTWVRLDVLVRKLS